MDCKPLPKPPGTTQLESPPMKNDKAASRYLSTTQAAQRLGLSVGTVQRMVESGVLQAYTTQGGHRRILATSLNHYCRGAVDVAGDAMRVCVLTQPEHNSPSLMQLSQIPGLQIIDNPLELAGMQHRIGVLFVDARIPWLPWQDLHLADSLGTEAHCIVYNSAQLPVDSRAALQGQAALHPGELSLALVQGYLLGSAATPLGGEPPLHVPAHEAGGALAKKHH